VGHASKSGGLLRLEASCARVSQSFSLFLEPINRTLEGWGSLVLLQFHFVFPILEVSQEQVLHFNNQMREGGRRPLCFV
jgi:hypothetical protein